MRKYVIILAIREEEIQSCPNGCRIEMFGPFSSNAKLQEFVEDYKLEELEDLIVYVIPFTIEGNVPELCEGF